jgi:predicted nucleic acid-binding protein
VLTELDPSTLDETSKIIIDSSALTKYASKEPDWLKIEKYVRAADSLEFALIETINALWKKTKKKEIKAESTKKIIRALGNTVWLLDERTYLERALDISTQYDIAVYDSLFLACAEMENSTLISCDDRQLEVAEELGVETIRV